MQKDIVKTFQGRLQGLGYYHGEIDGDAGTMTSSATVAFKTAHGLAARDYVGPITMTTLFSTAAKAAPIIVPPSLMPSVDPSLDLLLAEARKWIGLKEIPGPVDNEQIVKWGKAAGITWWNNDDDAWCAVAINGWLVACGFPSTKSALARSFCNYGKRITVPVPGAIGVIPRGSSPTFGHVFLIEKVHANGTVTAINGNVSNMVKRSTYTISSILNDGLRLPIAA
ncbi:NlpC/P60 family protein [Jiella pacifica]|uniref:TIGR02594 family protein n=1 Tax=Jiella pacifica TaxID=2696469 RepID=A0A6N9T1I9_9HYPH|nr:TIGR02594 family protein [Jiella pacifica]NDW04055.1 TIGR02594 family protein [Jiella pacifica]